MYGRIGNLLILTILQDVPISVFACFGDCTIRVFNAHLYFPKRYSLVCCAISSTEHGHLCSCIEYSGTEQDQKSGHCREKRTTSGTNSVLYSCNQGFIIWLKSSLWYPAEVAILIAIPLFSSSVM